MSVSSRELASRRRESTLTGLTHGGAGGALVRGTATQHCTATLYYNIVLNHTIETHHNIVLHHYIVLHYDIVPHHNIVPHHDILLHHIIVLHHNYVPHHYIVLHHNIVLNQNIIPHHNIVLQLHHNINYIDWSVYYLKSTKKRELLKIHITYAMLAKNALFLTVSLRFTLMFKLYDLFLKWSNFQWRISLLGWVSKLEFDLWWFQDFFLPRVALVETW